MRIKLILVFLILLIQNDVRAQAPQKLSYQAVLRDASQSLLVNKAVGVRVSILQGSVIGVAVYSEIHSGSTNANGLLTLEIGGGRAISGSFSTVNWAKGPYFIKTETDPTGGVNYSIIGTAAFLSVPYALFAANANYGDTSATNELQILSRKGDTILLSMGGYVVLPKMKIEDTSATNELQVLSIRADTLFLSEGGFVKLPQADSAAIAKMGFVTQKNLISAGKVYKVGDTLGGGIVFFVNSTGTHGLISELVDQSSGGVSYGLSEDAISNPANHSSAGKQFHDWRVPTLFELGLMYSNLHNKGLGGFSSGNYWSCSFADNSLPIPGWYINFSNGSSSTTPRSTTSHRVRAVRSF